MLAICVCSGFVCVCVRVLARVVCVGVYAHCRICSVFVCVRVHARVVCVCVCVYAHCVLSLCVCVFARSVCVCVLARFMCVCVMLTVIYAHCVLSVCVCVSTESRDVEQTAVPFPSSSPSLSPLPISPLTWPPFRSPCDPNQSERSNATQVPFKHKPERAQE